MPGDAGRLAGGRREAVLHTREEQWRPREPWLPAETRHRCETYRRPRPSPRYRTGPTLHSCIYQGLGLRLRLTDNWSVVPTYLGIRQAAGRSQGAPGSPLDGTDRRPTAWRPVAVRRPPCTDGHHPAVRSAHHPAERVPAAEAVWLSEPSPVERLRHCRTEPHAERRLRNRVTAGRCCRRVLGGVGPSRRSPGRAAHS
jgi:hypothetical protein